MPLRQSDSEGFGLCDLPRSWEAATSVITIPGLGLLRIRLILAFWEWYRRAEFTCDRAGLLCVQDPESALSALGKLAEPRRRSRRGIQHRRRGRAGTGASRRE